MRGMALSTLVLRLAGKCSGIVFLLPGLTSMSTEQITLAIFPPILITRYVNRLCPCLDNVNAPVADLIRFCLKWREGGFLLVDDSLSMSGAIRFIARLCTLCGETEGLGHA